MIGKEEADLEKRKILQHVQRTLGNETRPKISDFRKSCYGRRFLSILGFSVV